jgi:diadenosine tetraphosphate (Ap4A) HIT family hydrolase
MSSAACIFCKIIKGADIPRRLLIEFDPSRLVHISHLLTAQTGDIPSFKLFESEKVLAFLDIQPLSRGHAVGSLF